MPFLNLSTGELLILIFLNLITMFLVALFAIWVWRRFSQKASSTSFDGAKNNLISDASSEISAPGFVATQADIAVQEAEVNLPPGAPHVIYNPSKNANWEKLRKVINNSALNASLPEPVWLETTVEDPGFGQAKAAIEARASLVIAAGGDGTVRLVAEALAGSETPLAIVPVGTGNLLARNLDLPINNVDEAVMIAFTGKEIPLDLGYVEVPEPEETAPSVLAAEAANASAAEKKNPDVEKLNLAKPGKYSFVVIGGIGFAADIMEATNSEAKAKFGWLAYVQGAFANLFTSKMKVKIAMGEYGNEIESDARSVMFVNCGTLTGGIVIDRNADPSDTWMELAILDVRGGIFGWADVARRVLLRGAGFEFNNMLGLDSVFGDIRTERVRVAALSSDTYQQVQIDGDAIGLAKELRTYLEPQAIKIRVRSTF